MASGLRRTQAGAISYTNSDGSSYGFHAKAEMFKRAKEVEATPRPPIPNICHLNFRAISEADRRPARAGQAFEFSPSLLFNAQPAATLLDEKASPQYRLRC